MFLWENQLFLWPDISIFHGCPHTEALEKEFETASFPWRPGDACEARDRPGRDRGFPAVHCQVGACDSDIK